MSCHANIAHVSLVQSTGRLQKRAAMYFTAVEGGTNGRRFPILVCRAARCRGNSGRKGEEPKMLRFSLRLRVRSGMEND